MDTTECCVRYPEMRSEVVEAVRALADPGYQERVWGSTPTRGYYDDLTMNVHILFDDACVLPEPDNLVGAVLYPNEVGALRTLGERLEAVIAELGDAADACYLDHARWPDVISAAHVADQQLRTSR